MPEFVDASGTKWAVDLDGLLLADVKDKAGIDIVADGLHSIETREDALTKVLLVLCGEQKQAANLTDRQFAKLLAGEVAGQAIDAVRGAAQLFFRPSRWSEIQSRSDSRKESDQAYLNLKPLLDILDQPQMPIAMKQAVMGAIELKIRESAATSSTSSTVNPSASGQDATLPNAVGDLQVSSESTRAA